MTVLIIGLLLWIATHMFKRLAPDARAAMDARMGKKAKGAIALLLVLSIVLMVIGYKIAPYVAVYDLPVWGRHLNNLLMVIAVVLFGLGNSKSRLRAKMRHPMLWGTALWGVAHLLANGDLASIVLFGGILAWALAEMPLINGKVHSYVPYDKGTAKGDIRLAVISLVVFIVIVGIHGLVGPWPLGGQG
ncbi:NnrU family protein [Profundibacterium mesophilum]|uniref:Denitrification regulatory protein n=1 Tax=Profundibacterium mesophilum KAUST100406-0324 TaxID=1037889 RepID=A0A921NVB3_9RHOB|nr:NnrU family protein [Profundibacterium mesophilum]KAF0677344.1 Denitrification regulatory protein [Profundibacterium mesophilum KAUST100406-0324]